MDKLDFDILLTPIYSVIESQDVALVSGLASATQQIKNIVYLNYGDRPFNTGVGADLQSIFSSNLGNIVAINRIISTVSYSVPNISEVSASVYMVGDTPNVKIFFTYRTLTSYSKNNQIIIQLDPII